MYASNEASKTTHDIQEGCRCTYPTGGIIFLRMYATETERKVPRRVPARFGPCLMLSAIVDTTFAAVWKFYAAAAEKRPTFVVIGWQADKIYRARRLFRCSSGHSHLPPVCQAPSLPFCNVLKSSPSPQFPKPSNLQKKRDSTVSFLPPSPHNHARLEAYHILLLRRRRRRRCRSAQLLVIVGICVHREEPQDQLKHQGHISRSVGIRLLLPDCCVKRRDERLLRPPWHTGFTGKQGSYVYIFRYRRHTTEPRRDTELIGFNRVASTRSRRSSMAPRLSVASTPGRPEARTSTGPCSGPSPRQSRRLEVCLSCPPTLHRQYNHSACEARTDLSSLRQPTLGTGNIHTRHRTILHRRMYRVWREY